MTAVRVKRPRSYLYRYYINNKNKYLFDKKSFVIVSSREGQLLSNQIESMRRVLSRRIKGRRGKVYVRARVALPYTQKSKQSRMGKGKGKIKHLFCRVNVGDALFELRGKKVNRRVARVLSKKLHHKRPSLCVKVDDRSNGFCRNKTIRR